MAPTTRRPRAAHVPAPERRAQFVRAALGLFAERGAEGVRLMDVSAAVGVSPNLVHHYFPGGREELYRAAVHLACNQITSSFDVRPEVPLDRRMQGNIRAYLDHVLTPTPAYLLYAQAVHGPDPAAREITEGMRDLIATATALNWLGEASPDPRTRAVIVGLLAFLETTAERWRRDGLGSRDALEAVVAEILQATIEAIRRPR